jgi:nucleotide-binding universal stress UspA family protein
MESERQRSLAELTTLLAANDLQGGRWFLRVEKGGPIEIISRAVSEMRADLLVMGIPSRSVVLRTLIGSVTEEALRSLSVDILAVPRRKK